jgi:MFS family permease
MMRFQYMQPASADIYMTQFTSLIEFKVLNPQTLIRLWNPEFDLKSLIVGAKQQIELSKDQRESFFDEMFIYIFLAGVFVVFVILAYIASKIFQKYSVGDKLKKMLINTRKKTFFNGMIRSFSISYIKLGVASSIQIMMMVNASQFIKEAERINSLVIFSFMWLSLFAIYFFIWKNQDKLDEKEFKDKFGNLHAGIHLRRTRSNHYYFPNFLLRRLIFVLIPICLIDYPAQALQAWLFITVLYIIYFDGSTRFILIGDNILYTINDFFCLIQIYHYISFTEFNRDHLKQFQMGFSMCVSMAIMLAINIGVMINKSVKESRR